MTTPRNFSEKWTSARSIMEVRSSKSEIRRKSEIRISFRLPSFEFFRKQLLRACRHDFRFRLQVFANKPGILQRPFKLRLSSLKGFGRGLNIDPGRAVLADDGIVRHGDSSLFLAGNIDKT